MKINYTDEDLNIEAEMMITRETLEELKKIDKAYKLELTDNYLSDLKFYLEEESEKWNKELKKEDDGYYDMLRNFIKYQENIKTNLYVKDLKDDELLKNWDNIYEMKLVTFLDYEENHEDGRFELDLLGKFAENVNEKELFIMYYENIINNDILSEYNISFSEYDYEEFVEKIEK